MMRLLRVELLRFRSRRTVKVIGLGALAIVALIMVVQFLTHAKDDGTAAERWRAERAANYEQELQNFREQKANDPAFPSEFREVTKEEYVAGAEFYGGFSQPDDKQYRAAHDLQEGVKAVGFIFAFAAFLLGVTAAGAEWSAGTMQSLLFWDSRRMTVVVAKVVAVVLSMVVLALLGEVLAHAAGYGVSVLRGSTDGMTSGWWASQALTAARALGLVAFAAVIGFAIAFATRNTGFALGVAFVYFAILQQLLIAWKPWLMRYVLIGPMGAWMNQGFEFFYGGGESPADVPKRVFISTREGGIQLLVYALIAIALAAGWFKQRDVT